MADIVNLYVVDSMTNYSEVKAHQEKYGKQGISWHSLVLKRR